MVRSMKFILIIMYILCSFFKKDISTITVKIDEKILHSKFIGVRKTVVLETQIGKMSGYGPDCYGCSGYLASGGYVGDGKIYYDDPTYGKIRIVAADPKYKFGTIVRISNSNLSDEFLAIVLDRGGAIGLDKRCMFDLLYSSEEEANIDGISDDVFFEILRYGY